MLNKMSVVSENRKKSMKAYYEKNKKTIIEKQIEYQEEYRQKNKEILAEKAKEYYEKHKEQIEEYQKEYRQVNKEQLKEYGKKRREIKYTCECGAECLIQHKNRHLNTKKHLKYLEKK